MTEQDDAKASPSSAEASQQETGIQDSAAKRTRQTATAQREPKVKKPKIRTYVRRRTEIEALTEEIKRLQKQMEFYAHRTELLKQREELMQRELINRTMHKALQEQRLTIANSISMFSQFLRTSGRPFELQAHLGKDPAERQESLLQMKCERLEISQQFIAERQHFLSAAEFCDRKRFQATNGDMVSLRFEVVPLPGACSVKAIVAALQTYIYNIEISISGAVGDITVRENDDPKPGCAVAQNRLVSTLANGVQVDTNNIAFGEYHPAQGEQTEYGILVCDVVEEDELFPYRPLERVRQDMTVIIMIAWHQNENGEPVIVLSRWWCLRARSPHIAVPPYLMDRIFSGIDKVGTAMLTTARNA